MEQALGFMMDIVAFCLALMIILASLAVGFGDVKALRGPLARVIFTPLLAVFALWILFHGIQHMFSR